MALEYNIFIEQGTDFQLTMNIADETGAPLDLSTYEAYSQMRRSYDSPDAVDITVDISDAENGEVTLFIPHVDTVNLRPGRYLYDVEIVSVDNVISRILEGQALVSPGVTVI
jgi:hypothetical protein